MKVKIFGGTHGNESTGICIVEQYASEIKKNYPKLDVEFILANPEARNIGKRYKDEDLNRAFQFLGESRTGSYEHERAKEIRKLITQEPCFVIDLHTTTSNMGRTCILTNYHRINLSVASKLSHKFSDCRIIGSPDPKKKYLGSQSDYGLMIEVGAIANGVVDGKILESTLELISAILDELSLGASENFTPFDLYEEVQDVSYPTNSAGEISAYIHPEFQGQDFVPLRGKFTPFKTFSGQVIIQETQEELFPIFINEAAYYPTRLAFSLCKKVRLTFDAWQN